MKGYQVQGQRSESSDYTTKRTVRGSNSDNARRFFSCPEHANRPWSAPRLLCNWHQGSFPGVTRPASNVDHCTN